MGRWLLREPNQQARLRLFCFPHAGAGASAYRAWSAPLAADGFDVCPVQLPGRESRLGEPAYRAIEPLVEDLVDGIAPYLDRPYALFGHSMGALVAFELARSLRQRGAALPCHLFASGRIAPQREDPRPKLHDLADAVLLARVLELGGVPSELRAAPELMEFQLPLLRADLAVNENYRYVSAPPLAVPITAFAGKQDPKTDHAEIGGWAEHTSAGFTMRSLPGGHFFVHDSMQLLLRYLVVDLSWSLSMRSCRAGH